MTKFGSIISILFLLTFSGCGSGSSPNSEDTGDSDSGSDSDSGTASDSDPDIEVGSLLTPFDANKSDKLPPTHWNTKYGKSPEIIVASNGTELDILAQDYDDATAWDAVILHVEFNGADYQVTQAITEMPTLDRVMGLDIDAEGNRYYATGVAEDGVVNATYPPLDVFRDDIVRVVKLNAAGEILFNIDVDRARAAYDSGCEPIINPMVASTSRLAVGGGEIALVHGINTDPDLNLGGKRHQKSLSTRLDSSNGDITRIKVKHCSHSFDQRLFYDGTHIIESHLGDGYPRQITFTDIHRNYRLLDIKGEVGDNRTFTRLGNMALIENDATYKYIALFATEGNGDYSQKINDARNLAIVRFSASDHYIDPSLPDTLDVISRGAPKTNKLRWITSYTADEKLHAERPKIIGIGSDQYVVLWEQWTTNAFQGVYAMVINAMGDEVVAAKLVTDAHHLHRGDDAFLVQGKAGWVTGNRANKELYLHLLDSSLNYEMFTLD